MNIFGNKLHPLTKKLEWWEVRQMLLNKTKESGELTFPQKLNTKIECIYTGISLINNYNYFNIEHIVPESIFRHALVSSIPNNR